MLRQETLGKKIQKKYPVLLFDIFSIALAWFGAYFLRYNLHPVLGKMTQSASLRAFIFLMTVQIACYYYFRVYRGLWRFSSLNDLLRITRAVVTATLLVIPVFYYLEWIYQIPRSILPLYTILLLFFLSGGRLCLRLLEEKRRKAGTLESVKNVVIVGAGVAGESLLRDLKRHSAYRTVAIVDDDTKKRDLEIHGVRVLGGLSDLERIVQKTDADLIFIAIPTANSTLMRRIVSYCVSSGVPFRTLPGLQALASGHVAVNALREVSLEDLLGRDQVRLDLDHIAGLITHKKIVVTGGGGSIGSELCRQILRFNPNRLLIIDNSEYNLYSIEQELRAVYDPALFEISLLSVTDAQGIDRAFATFKPDIVFHAAAFKHVPMLEDQIRMATLNNILGTKIAAQCSVQHGAAKFILISTDKAVNPVNIMGASKRIAEIFCQNFNQHVATEFITVRFGNVLGSAGSVIPLFQKQLQSGGPLTVTHPDVERYFMTIPEACQLILQAAVNGTGGEIFVLDMGEPVKIRYLAEQMIRLSGREPGIDVHIEYTGLRAGEKLFEELFHTAENLAATNHEKLFKAQIRLLDWKMLMGHFYHVELACEHGDSGQLMQLFKKLVPELHLASHKTDDIPLQERSDC